MWCNNKLCISVLVTITIVLTSQVSADGYEQPYYSHSNGGFYGDADRGYMSANWGAAGLQQKKCIDIPQNMSLCKNIGYNKMRIPNLLDHDTMREVTEQAAPWVPLLGIRCHPDTKLFLCSLFSPVCLDRPIWPCRSLCEAVKNGCETLMLKYGFPWPEMLRCDKFPADNDLCINLQHNNQPAVEEEEKKPDESVCEACSQPDTYEAIADNYCGAGFVLRIQADEHVVSGHDLKIVPKKKKKVKTSGISKRDFRNMVLYIKDGGDCDCNQLQQRANGGKKEKREYLVMGARSGDRLMVNYIIHMDMSNKDIKKAWKSMRKGNMCKNGLPSLPISNGRGKGKKDRRKGRKDRKSSEVLVTPASPSGTSPTVIENHHGNDNINTNNGNGGSNLANTNSENDRGKVESGKKRRKNCKNPKKCTTTGAGDTQQSNRRQNRDRTERRRNRKGSRA